MIYIIFDSSFELDDIGYAPNDEVYIGTNKEEAIEYFHKNYDRYKELNNNKWCYEARLYEYPDNWTQCDKKYPQMLLSVTNITDND